MFWKFAPTTSNIDNLLEREDITLQELLNEDDVLQECKGQNVKLVEFLCKKEVVEDLVGMITVEPAEDEDETVRYKFPNLACELLTSDVPQINDALGDSETIRKKLFSFLDKEPPVNPLLASFFSKVIGILLSRKPEPTLEYIKSQEDFLASVLKHLGTSAIMDLLLRMVTCVEAAELRAQVLTWLNENQLVQRLIALIDPEHDEELHCNSAQSLCDIIRLSREHMYTMQESAQEDPLLNTLEREETVSLLLQHMFDGEIVESVIVNGISVLLALLEIRRPAPFGFPDMAPELTQLDVERLARGVSRTLHGVSGRLSDFHKLLLNPPKQEVMKCTFGELEPPLGNTRLHVGKLLTAILMTNTHNINSQLAELKIFDSLLDLFFKYEYNNFLHTQVSGCVHTVLGNAANVPSYPMKTESASTNADQTSEPAKHEDEDSDVENPHIVAPLLAHLFEECRIIQRIMDAWEDNHRHENDDGGHRKGNMGHLTLITNYIVTNLEKGTNCERLKRFLSEMPEEDQGRWQKFLSETLSDMNEKNTRELGGHNPMHFSSDEEGDTDFRDVPFSTDHSLQQGYTDYQLQQMTSNFIDQFGFTDEDFAEPDDHIKFDKMESIEIDMKGDTNAPSAQLFEAVCKERVAYFDENLEEEGRASDQSEDDIWEDRPASFEEDATGSPRSNTISTTPTVTVRHGGTTESTDSDSSSDETPTVTPIKIPDAEQMDTSQSPGWKATFDESYDSSSSGSNSSTPTTSPRPDQTSEKKIMKPDSEHPMDIGHELKPDDVSSSTVNSDENWANFAEFPSNALGEVSNNSGEQRALSPNSSLPFTLADSTSKDSIPEDPDAGSPMAVAYNQHSPGEAADSSQASSTMDTQTGSDSGVTVSSSEHAVADNPIRVADSSADIDMDDVSSTPDFQLVETEIPSSHAPTGEVETQDGEGPSSSIPSSSVPAENTQTDAMDMDPTSTEESEIKRQRIEVNEQRKAEEAVTSGLDEELKIESTVTITSTSAMQSNVRAPDVVESSEKSDGEISSSAAAPDQEEHAVGLGNSEVSEVAGSGDEDRGENTDLPDTSSAPHNPDSPDLAQTSAKTNQATDISPPMCPASDFVQHNEVSSSSAVEAKLSNTTSGPNQANTSSPPAPEMKLNGPV